MRGINTVTFLSHCCLLICLPLAEPNQKIRDIGTRRSTEVSLLGQKSRWRRVKGNPGGGGKQNIQHTGISVCSLVNNPVPTKRWQASQVLI